MADVIPLPTSGRGLPPAAPRRRVPAALRAYVIQRDSGICWLCGHPGATQADEIIPHTEGGDPFSADNLKAAHGSHSGAGNPCPVCTKAAHGHPVYCNQIRGSGSPERARRKIIGKIKANGGIPPAELTGEPARETGRVW